MIKNNLVSRCAICSLPREHVNKQSVFELKHE